MAHGGKRTGAGRTKGKLGKNTILAEAAKTELIAAYMENIKPINAALIKKAKRGDIMAIKELHDRVYGKAVQSHVGDPDNPIVHQITGMKIVKEK